MSTVTRLRRRVNRRPVGPKPVGRPGFAKRLGSGLRRRAAFAWRRLTAGRPRPAAEAAWQWLIAHGGADGITPAADQRTPCPGVTGGAIETALAFGAREEARRWARWLRSIQQADGSLGDGSSSTASLFNTAQAARGLLAVEGELPEAATAARAACGYLWSRIDRNARTLPSETPSVPSETLSVPSAESRAILLACLPPLWEGARRFQQPDWEAAVRRIVTGELQTIEPSRPELPTHRLAWRIEALIELGCRETAACLLQSVAAEQRRDGSVPATPDAVWVSSAGLAHLAVCWYKLAGGDPLARRRADRALQYLARRQRREGGFRGSWGRGATYHPKTEIAWTAKHYLDAAWLQVGAAFDHRPMLREGFSAMSPSETPPTSPSETAPTFAMPSCVSDVPDWIDPADGRVQAVRRWFAELPPDARVADVGCGRGRFLRRLMDWFPDARLTGIDLSMRMLDDLPPGAAAMQGSLLRIPAADGTFDGTFAVESLEHCLLPARAVAELCRVVRAGGRVLIIDKHRRRQSLSLYEPWERWFTPRELAGWLSRFCDEVRVVPVSHLEGRGGNRLFLAATGRKR